MRDGADFRAAVRGGGRGVQPALVTHVVVPSGGAASTLVGLVVSKAVGPAVDRNRVKRRLRHLMRDRVDLLPSGARVVVRALPASATSSSAELADQLDAALAKSRARAS